MRRRINTPHSSRAGTSVFWRLLAVALTLSLVATACGGGSSDSADEGADDTPADTSTDTAADASGSDDAPADDEPEPEDEEPADEPADEPEPAAEPADEPAEEPADEPAEEDLEPLTASAVGVTESEISVGITMLDFAGMAEFNAVTEGWGDQQAVYQAYVDDLNARGGVHGRTIVPTYEFYNPLFGATEADAACTALTKDIETFVIIGGFLGPSEVSNNCVVETNNTILIGGAQTEERLATATASWVNTAAARERRLPAFLDLLATEGRLDGRSIAVVGSIEQEDIYDVAPDAFAAVGVEPVLYVLNDVPQGDITASDARWQVLAENIRAVGADTVLLIGSTQAGLRGIADSGIGTEVWVLESTGLDSLGADTTPDDADGAYSITSLTNPQQWDHPTMAGCREVAEAAFPDMTFLEPIDHQDGDERWFRAIHLYCRNMAIFELIANAAGRNPTQESWADAVANLGSFELPGVPFASGGKPDLSDTFQLVQFDASAGENGILVSVSEPFDGAS